MYHYYKTTQCTLDTEMYHVTLVHLQGTITSHTHCLTCADLHAEVIWVDHVSDLAQVVLCDLHFPVWTKSFRLDVFTGSQHPTVLPWILKESIKPSIHNVTGLYPSFLAWTHKLLFLNYLKINLHP